MKYSVAALIAATAVGVSAQTPAGCTTQGTGKYELTILQIAASRRSIEKRAECGGGGTLVMELNNGILTDSKGRIGSIVANRQFQFDGPPAQAGALYASGWSVCQNSSLAIHGSTIFYQCASGGAPYNAQDFYNLYDQPVGANCREVRMDTIPCTIGGGAGTGPTTTPASSPVSTPSQIPVTQSTDGQVTASSATTTVVSQASDGQPTASSAPVVTQISDGQAQATASSNGTVTTAGPSSVHTGAAATNMAGAIVAMGAAAALFL